MILLKKKRTKDNRLKIKTIFVILLFSNAFIRNYFNHPPIKESLIKIFVMTHKDFNNHRLNKNYIIVADDKTQLKNKYNLNVIYANNGVLYNMRRAYGEMSKLYYIYKLYKDGILNSKYIGLNHYRRYFYFRDKIPDMNGIFKKYDIILNLPKIKPKGMKKQYCRYHLCHTYDEIIKIIKDLKPDYYKAALKTIKLKKIYFNNIFIMKKADFLKYCEFIYDTLFEFDRRHNFTRDSDVFIYSKKFYHANKLSSYEARLEGFLAERLNNIFFCKHFRRIKEFNLVSN